MTRALPLAAAAMVTIAACSAPESPEPTAKPTEGAVAATPQRETVHILVAGPDNPVVGAWAEALAAAIEAGHGDLALVPTPEEARLVVMIEGVDSGAPAGQAPPGEGEAFVVRGSLIIGDDARDFDLAYRGDMVPQAEALARNLPRFAQEAASGGATVEKTAPAPAAGGTDTDEGVH
jgi:hypothetical protein